MKTKRYSDAQIMGVLKQVENGVPVPRALPRTRDEPRELLQKARDDWRDTLPAGLCAA